MAKNDLTPLQDVITREFLVEVALAENTLPANPAMKKSLIGTCYNLLNYDRLGDGRFITKGTKIKMSFGLQPSTEDYPDEWNEDYQAALQALEEESASTDGADSNKANRRFPSKDSKVRKTIFSKDV